MTSASPPPAGFAIAKVDWIAGMAKGMAVLESFDTDRQRLNATLAAQRAGITRAAARRHLLTLAALGYLETDGSYFWLSSKVLRFSGTYLASARLPRVVQPTLNRLAAQTQEAFSVVVLDGAEVVIIARSGHEGRHASLEKSQLLAYGLHLGARLPAHATSTGRMLLSGLPNDELHAWLRSCVLRRLTALTVTDVPAFEALLEVCRTDDYCWTAQEYELGVQALAVPLRDTRGYVLGALNVVAPMHRWEPTEFRNTLLPVLQDAAQELRGLL